MDITFLLLRWLIIFTGYFLLGLSIGTILAFIWYSYKEKKESKELMRELISKRK